jgi:hypothetical protein
MRKLPDASKLRAKEQRQRDSKSRQVQLRVNKEEQLKVKDAKEYAEKLRQEKERLLALEKENDIVIANAHKELSHALDTKMVSRYGAVCQEINSNIEEAINIILQALDNNIIFRNHENFLKLGFSEDELQNFSLSNSISKIPLEYNYMFQEIAELKHLSVIRPKKFKAYFQTWNNYIEGSGLLLRELDEHFDEIFDVMEEHRLQLLTLRKRKLDGRRLWNTVTETLKAIENLPRLGSDLTMKLKSSDMAYFSRAFAVSLHNLRRVYRLRSFVERGQATSPRSLIFCCWIDLLECESFDFKFVLRSIREELHQGHTEATHLEGIVRQSEGIMAHMKYLVKVLREVSALFVEDEPGPGWRSTFSKFDVDVSNFYQSWLSLRQYYYNRVLIDPQVLDLPWFRNMENNIKHQVSLVREIEILYRALWSKQRAYWIRNSIPVDIGLRECSYEIMLRRLDYVQHNGLIDLRRSAKDLRFKIDGDIVQPLPLGPSKKNIRLPMKLRRQIQTINSNAMEQVGLYSITSHDEQGVPMKKKTAYYSGGRRRKTHLYSTSGTYRRVRSQSKDTKCLLIMRSKMSDQSSRRSRSSRLSQSTANSRSNVSSNQTNGQGKQSKNTTPTMLFKLDNDLYRKAEENLKPNPVFFSHQLFRGPEDTAVIIHYCTKFNQSEKVAQKFLGEEILGFDLEWAPNARTTDSIKHNASVIQIASPSRVAIFHIAAHYGDTVEKLLPPSLRQILESTQIIKAGVNILGDFTRLKRYLTVQAHGLIELSHLHNLINEHCNGYGDISKKTVSLANLVQDHLGLPLSKDFNIRTSNWRLPLNKEQTNYAANDAYAGLQLFYSLESKRVDMDLVPPRPPFAELQQTIPLSAISQVESDEDNTDWSSESSLSSNQFNETDNSDSDGITTNSASSQIGNADSIKEPTIITISRRIVFRGSRRILAAQRASNHTSLDSLDNGWSTEESDINDDSDVKTSTANVVQRSKDNQPKEDAVSNFTQ